MPKLSSFGRGKKIRPKKSLTRLLHEALQLDILHTLRRFSRNKTLVSGSLQGSIEDLSFRGEVPSG